MDKQARILVAGAETFIGTAIARALVGAGFRNVVGTERDVDATDRSTVERLFDQLRPEYVFVAAGKIAGIGANQQYPAELMFHNLLVTAHLVDAAARHGATKLLYMGSSCGYPKHCPQPMRPEHLLTSSLEPTSEFYALAKLAGVKLCEAYRRQYGVQFIAAIPSNPFGPGDDFDPEHAHVIGSLMHKMHGAMKSGQDEVVIWGSGTPSRDFIFIDDLADACVLVMEVYEGAEPVNLGSGRETSIAELAHFVAEAVGYRGALVFDRSKPDGMPAKILDSSRLRELGWKPRTPLAGALRVTYEWFVRTQAAGVGAGG